MHEGETQLRDDVPEEEIVPGIQPFVPDGGTTPTEKMPPPDPDIFEDDDDKRKPTDTVDHNPPTITYH